MVPGEETAIQERIVALEKELKEAKERLEMHENRLSKAGSAMTNLALILPKAENGLHVHEDSIEDLRRPFKSLEMPNGSDGQQKYDRREASIVHETSPQDINSSKGTEFSIKPVSAPDKDTQTDAQSPNWFYPINLSKNGIADAEATVEKISLELYSLKSMQSAIWKIPTELWIDIFRLRLDSEVDYYLFESGSDEPPFRAKSLMNLASVCRLWRQIILNEPGMWNIVYVHPSRYVPKRTHEMLLNSLSRGREPFTIISNLSRSIPPSWNEDTKAQDHSPPSSTANSPGNKPLNNTSSGPNLQKNEPDISGTHYLRLMMQDDSPSCIERAQNFPFHKTEDLELNIRSPGSYNGLTDLLRCFPQTKNLLVICPAEQLEQLRDITGILPSLEYLFLQMNSMPKFDLTALLRANLTELRVYHTGDSGIGRLNDTLHLPTLNYLGVMYPSYSLLESFEVPNLVGLGIRGPPYRRPYSEYGSSARIIFQTIQTLRLMSFKDLSVCVSSKDPNDLHDAASVFARLATTMCRLQSVTFLTCDLPGSKLIDTFKSRSEPSNEVLPNFETLKITHCRTITRAECEKLQTLVPRFIVHV
jgi:hypothetical protein